MMYHAKARHMLLLLRLRARVAYEDVRSFPKDVALAMRDALMEVGDGALCTTADDWEALQTKRWWTANAHWAGAIMFGSLGIVSVYASLSRVKSG